MASLEKHSEGFTLRVIGKDGKRRPIRLGKMNKKAAEGIRRRVENLHAYALNNIPMDPDTAEWVGGIGDELAAKLAALGLIQERRQAVTLAGLLEIYGREKQNQNKPGTKTNHRTISNDLNGFFGESTDPRTLTEDHASRFLDHLRKRKLAPATVARRVVRVRTIFAYGVKRKYLTENPFTELKVTSVLPEDRKAYVPPEDARKLMDAANPTWRTIIALARFAGLRCPSEVLTLKWSDLNFETGKMTVSSPKTERIPGKEYRVMPMFTELRPYLDEAFELAEPGEVFVVGGKQGDGYRLASQRPQGWVNCNLRTTFEKIIRRAGLKQWPRVFHTLRASCETDLLADFPINAVTEWMGHSATVALKHYSRVPEHLFERAGKPRFSVENVGAESGAEVGQFAGQTGFNSIGQEKKNATETPISQASRRVLSNTVPSCSDGAMTLRRFELRSQP